ncbi:MAG: hypothetical protein ACTSQ4_02250 [Candidatus Heimdallarchaeaceae archaeon]
MEEKEIQEKFERIGLKLIAIDHHIEDIEKRLDENGMKEYVG